MITMAICALVTTHAPLLLDYYDCTKYPFPPPSIPPHHRPAAAATNLTSNGPSSTTIYVFCSSHLNLPAALSTGLISNANTTDASIRRISAYARPLPRHMRGPTENCWDAVLSSWMKGLLLLDEGGSQRSGRNWSGRAKALEERWRDQELTWRFVWGGV